MENRVTASKQNAEMALISYFKTYLCQKIYSLHLSIPKKMWTFFKNNNSN